MKEGDIVVLKSDWKEIISNGHYDYVAIIEEFSILEKQYFVIENITKQFNLLKLSWMGGYYWGNSEWFEIINHSKLTDYCYSDFLIDTNTKGVI